MTKNIGTGVTLKRNGNGNGSTGNAAQTYVPPSQPAKAMVFLAPDGTEFATAEEALAHAMTLDLHKPREVSLKVSEKGGVSAYGLGRFPVTLYKEQWLKLLDKAEGIRSFIKANESKLKAKGQK